MADSPEPSGFEFDRRSAAALAIALFALGAYVGAEFLRLPGTEDSKIRALSAQKTTMPAPLDRGILAAAKAHMDYREFMELFGAVEKHPQARAFAKAFKRNPELSELWEDFQEDRNPQELISALKHSDAFRELLTEQSREAGFRSLVQDILARAPALSELLRGAKPSEASARLPEALRVPGARSPTPARVASPELGLRAFGRMGRKNSPGFGSASSRNAGAEEAGGSDETAAALSSAGGSAQGEGGARMGAANRLGAEAHEVKPGLAAIPAASTDPMLTLLQRFPWLAGLSDSERRSILAWIDTDGLWGACFRLEIYKRCADACGAAATGCTVVSGWQACLQFKDNDAAACRGLCSRQPGCQAPAAPGGAAGSSGRSFTCDQLCGPWQAESGCGGGGCGPKRRFRTRSCPTTAGCSESDCWLDGSGCEN